MAGEVNEMDAHYTTFCDLKEAREKIKELNRRCQKAESALAAVDEAAVARILKSRQPGKPYGRMQANFLLMELMAAILPVLQVPSDWNIEKLRSVYDRINEHAPFSTPPSSGSSSS